MVSTMLKILIFRFFFFFSRYFPNQGMGEGGEGKLSQNIQTKYIPIRGGGQSFGPCPKFGNCFLEASLNQTACCLHSKPFQNKNKCQLGISVSMMLHRSVTRSPIPHPKWNNILLQTHLTNRPTVDRRLGEPIND